MMGGMGHTENKKMNAEKMSAKVAMLLEKAECDLCMTRKSFKKVNFQQPLLLE
uniref:Uncharacterized protein n=1 Tax=Parascaris univalens TaxID=6257 RepID=A0A915B7I5_PARUN